MARQGFFQHFDFGVEVFLFCFKLTGHWLILDATNKTHKNVQTQWFLDWFSFSARLDLWYLMWQARTPSCIRMWRLACICIVCKCLLHVLCLPMRGVHHCVGWTFAGQGRQYDAAWQTRRGSDSDWAFSSQSSVSAGWEGLFHVWPVEVPVVLWQWTDVWGSEWVRRSGLSLCVSDF